MPKRTITIVFSVVVSLFYSLSFAQSSPIFGPKKYTREKGKPEKVKEAFQVCALSGIYKLIVENGLYIEAEDEKEKGKDKDKEERKTKVSAAEIEINGEEIIEEDDFSKKVTKIEKTILLPQGENHIQVEIEGEPGAYIKVTIECQSGCLEPKITTPADNNTINKSRATIQGNLANAYGEIGITLQSSGANGQVSILAEAQGTSFAGIAPLQQGQNTITATATDACGYQAHDTITINTESIQEQIRLTANPQSGIPTTNGTFTTTLEADAYLPNPISGYSWDTDGDGTAEQSGKDLSKITAAYIAPGLYFPKVTVTDSQNNTYMETAIINVLSKEQMDALLKGKWEGMKGALGSGNTAKALSYFDESVKQKFSRVFSDLGGDLPVITASFEDITLVSFTGDIAEYAIGRNQDSQRYIYFIYYMKDKDGIWKIKGM
jgi:hypothetical protein